jgi:hypothetical protein
LEKHEHPADFLRNFLSWTSEKLSDRVSVYLPETIAGSGFIGGGVTAGPWTRGRKG